MIREHCLSLPHTTEQIQWENHLLFKIGGKMYAITSVDDPNGRITFKVDEEEFDELVEREGVMQAAYLAKRKWISIETVNTMPRAELRKRLTRSYELVKSGLTKKVQLELGKSSDIPKLKRV